MELIIYNQQETPNLIEFNFTELKQELTEKLGHYNSLTYTDCEIKTAKTDRATLNKFKLAIDNRRKEIKTQCMVPYNDFETKVKQIINLIDQPILAIDTQVKTYEQKVKTEKRAEIIAFFNESVGELAELVPIEKVWVEQWLNVAESMKCVKEDIDLVLTRARNDLEVISGLQSEFELQIRETYLKDLNLTAALLEKKTLEDQKAKREAYNKAQEEAREQARVKAVEEAIAKAERAEEIREARENERRQAEAIPEPVAKIVEDEGYGVTSTTCYESAEEAAFAEVVHIQELIQVGFRAWVTPDLLEALEGFMQAYEIKYERVI